MLIDSLIKVKFLSKIRREAVEKLIFQQSFFIDSNKNIEILGVKLTYI